MSVKPRVGRRYQDGWLTSKRAASGAGTPLKVVPVLTHVTGNPLVNFWYASAKDAENTPMSSGFVVLEGSATSLTKCQG